MRHKLSMHQDEHRDDDTGLSAPSSPLLMYLRAAVATHCRRIRRSPLGMVTTVLFGCALALLLWMRCVSIATTRHAANSGDADSRVPPSSAVLLDGRATAKPLPQVYPNGAVNRHRCDLPALRYQCDLNASVGCMAYPQLFPMGDLLKNWSPEDPDKQPAHIFDSICRFNVSSPYELQLAQVFHQMEVPFIVYGIPELDRASTKWTDEYLTEKLNPNELYKVHIVNNSHFMYYSKSMAKLDEPPTYASKWWTYPQFVNAVAGAKTIEKKNSNGDHPYYYLMLKALDIKKRTPFVYEELEFLDPSAGGAKHKYGDLFIRNAQDALARGLRCRLGMQGIITEGHFDAGLNMITMVRGAKRYILSPPSVCSCLGIITTGASARHTRLNWSNVSALSSDAYACPATEAVVAAGDVLYVPSYWYHHIVSLDESIQCNIRSGVILRDDVKDFLAQCGFPPATETA